MHCPALPVKVAGSAGAGDAFNSTFAAYVLEQASAMDAAIAAAANAAAVIGYLDTQTGLLGRSALQARVASLGDIVKLRHWSV